MSRIKQFFIRTQKFSRVLVVLWFFFSSAGAGFDASEFIYTFPIMAIFFLLPAILIERKKNPVWIKAINESKIKKLEAETITNQQRKEEAIQLQQLKEENERLKQEADSEVAKVDQDTTNHLTFKHNDGGAVDSTQELSVVTGPSEEASPAIKEDPPSKNTKEKAPLSHRIGGVILIVLSSFLCLLIVPVFVLGEKKLIFPAMFGLGALMFGISLCCGKFMKFEQTLAFDGVRTGEIPIVGNYTSNDYDDDEEIAPTDISYIDGMEGHEFEYFCADILEKNGFTNVSVTRGSGDQGVDVLATKDGIKYAIQCKNYE
jgi:hypothetical protein